MWITTAFESYDGLMPKARQECTGETRAIALYKAIGTFLEARHSASLATKPQNGWDSVVSEVTERHCSIADRTLWRAGPLGDQCARG
jgi:hypothetical protein